MAYWCGIKINIISEPLAPAIFLCVFLLYSLQKGNIHMVHAFISASYMKGSFKSMTGSYNNAAPRLALGGILGAFYDCLADISSYRRYDHFHKNHKAFLIWDRDRKTIVAPGLPLAGSWRYLRLNKQIEK